MAVDKMTDEHFETFRRAAGAHVGLDREDCRLILQGLVEAGITLTLPEPRYYERPMTNRARGHEVYDRMAGAPVAAFWHYEDARVHAREYADRLNREETS